MKKQQYKQLIEHDRVRIEVLLNQGVTQYRVAKILGVHRSTISREIRNRGAPLSGYRSQQAESDYQLRKKKCGVKPKMENSHIGGYVIKKLKSGWSPEVISGRLKKEIKERLRDREEYLNHESIYQWIFNSSYGKEQKLYQYLKTGKKRRTHYYSRKTKREIIKNRRSIDDRPREINLRNSIGHWEGDTIMYGRQKGLNSLVERKTRFLVLTKIKDKTPLETASIIINRLKNHYSETLTLDNGIENKDHELISQKLGADIYFCHPYHSWEKGSNENTNGIVRRFLPKRTNLDTVTQGEVNDIAWDINNRPRKILGYLSPNEMLQLEYSKLSVVALNY